VALFAALAVVWLWPLHGQLATAIPGAGAGDNVVFVWNVWWTRYALLHGMDPLSSPLLLYPFGADLTLHTHTLLPALAVSFVRNPVLAQNALIFAHLFLNFVCAYALALRETRHRGAAVLAGLIFGWSPYVAAHLNGHFNLIAAWVLPLAALVTLWANEGRGIRRGFLLGVVLGVIAYVDYYYFIYASLLALLLLPGSGLRLWSRRGQVCECPDAVTRPLSDRKHRPDPGEASNTDLTPEWIRAILLGLAGLGAGAAAVVAATGGGTWRVAGVSISMRSAWNPLALAWVSALVWVLLRYASRWRLSVVRPDAARLRQVAGVAAGLALVVAPLAIAAIRLVLHGAYVSQPYLWRSAPRGIDLLTLVGGNPYSAVYGRFVRGVYAAAGVDAIEHVAWLGPALIALVFFGLRTRARTVWTLPLVVFSIWALGPFVQFGGHATPFWLPAVIVRWIPVVANARIPARAIVVVYLACAMLAAFGMKRLLADGRRTLAAALVGLLLIDYAAAPPPVVQLARPAVLDALRADPAAGAVLEVPMGLRDGFGETGTLDPNAMWLQTIHERPIAGGFVARLPRDAAARYLREPALAPLLELSPNPIGEDARALTALGFRYVLVNRALASAAAQESIRRIRSVSLVTEDAGYTLYRLTLPK
jgi:hypothetical protein